MNINATKRHCTTETSKHWYRYGISNALTCLNKYKDIIVLTLMKLFIKKNTLIDTTRSGHTNNVYLLFKFTLYCFLKVLRFCDLLIGSCMVFRNVMPCTVMLFYVLIRITRESNDIYSNNGASQLRIITIRGLWSDFTRIANIIYN